MNRLQHITNGAAKLAGSVLLPRTDASEARKQICNRCPQLTKGRQCTLCGCFVDAKVKFENEQCPVDKW